MVDYKLYSITLLGLSLFSTYQQVIPRWPLYFLILLKNYIHVFLCSLPRCVTER